MSAPAHGAQAWLDAMFPKVELDPNGKVAEAKAKAADDWMTVAREVPAGFAVDQPARQYTAAELEAIQRVREYQSGARTIK